MVLAIIITDGRGIDDEVQSYCQKKQSIKPVASYVFAIHFTSAVKLNQLKD